MLTDQFTNLKQFCKLARVVLMTRGSKRERQRRLLKISVGAAPFSSPRSGLGAVPLHLTTRDVECRRLPASSTQAVERSPLTHLVDPKG